MRRLLQQAAPRCLRRPACPGPAGALPLDADIDEFNRWSFLNRGGLDGQGAVHRDLESDSEQAVGAIHAAPNAYFRPAGLLSRFKAERSAVLDTGFRSPLSVFEIMDVWVLSGSCQ